MPLISRFFGISIYMYFGGHAPPHFHAKYNEEEALIEIEHLQLLAGNLPPRALGLVIEWAMLNKQELTKNWENVEQSLPLNKISPLT
ncbi:MAG: DUF4160 domain-containing protein [Sphingobacteriales bacterium]|nr:MAG: DUF4160 domain-containing protein [Sphingobacteriales bacterium]